MTAVADWEGAAAYRRWLDSPLHEELGGRLAPLLAGEVWAGAPDEEC